MIIVNRLEQTKAARSWVFSYPTDTISPKQMQARWCKDHCCGVDKNSGTVYRKITSWANLQVVFINNKNLFHNFINHYLKNSVIFFISTLDKTWRVIILFFLRQLENRQSANESQVLFLTANEQSLDIKKLVEKEIMETPK